MYDLIIANLILIFIYMLGRFKVVFQFINVLVWVIIAPVLFGIFLFYIIRPINDFLIKKGLKRKLASAITLISSIFLLGLLGKLFGVHLLKQINELREFIMREMKPGGLIDRAKEYINNERIKTLMDEATSEIIIYLKVLITNSKDIFDKGMMLFSNILLVILVVFCLLKDGNNFKPTVLKYIPNKYKQVADEILSDSDKVLFTYIRGQAIVALSLATMVFIGYKIIGIPSALILASTTFILAFIPFVGFFISMMIPYIIAIVMGFQMVIKLSILFIIAQTLKGRVVVPLIMGKAMKIHPITDIFLVVAAATIGGPIAAFGVVPIYSLIKLSINKLEKNNIISYPWVVDNQD